MSLPREVGLHPETGKPITAGLGRYGPFVLHDGTYANLENVEDVFSVGLNRAVTLIAEKAAGGKEAASSARSHDGPEGPRRASREGGKIEVLSGRYGPYVKHDKINATVPNGKDPAALTLEEAIELIAARAAKGGKKRPAQEGRCQEAGEVQAREIRQGRSLLSREGRCARQGGSETAKARQGARRCRGRQLNEFGQVRVADGAKWYTDMTR